MTNNTFGVVAFMGAWLTTIGGVWFLFEKADETLAPEMRARLSGWLKNVSPTHSSDRWPSQFIALFDRAFGSRHFSLLRLRRSAAASLIVSWIVGGWWLAGHSPQSFVIGAEAMLGVTLVTVAVSLLPDYASLLETRLVLGRMSRGGSTSFWLAFDVVATAILGALPYAAAVLWRVGYSSLPKALWQLVTFQITMTVNDTLADGTAVVYAMPMSPFFYATFFTSFWVWLFAVTGPTVRAMEGLLSGFTRLRGILDVEEKPGRSLGLAAVILVTALYALAVPVLLLLRPAG